MSRIPRVPFRRSGRQRSWQEWRAIFASIARRKGIKAGRGRLVNQVLGRERLAQEIKSVRAQIRDPRNPNFGSDDLVRLLRDFHARRKSRGKGMQVGTGKWEKVKGSEISPIERARRHLADEQRRRLIRNSVQSEITRLRSRRPSRPRTVADRNVREVLESMIPNRRIGAGSMNRIFYTPKVDSYNKALLIMRASNFRPVKLARNTILHRSEPGRIMIKYHDTDIVTHIVTGDNIDRVRLNTGGFRTKSTMNRINHYLPADWRVDGTADRTWSRRAVRRRRPWALINLGNGRVYDFYDGIEINLVSNRVT